VAYTAWVKQAAQKVVEGEKNSPGAKARAHFQGLSGTTEVVPFPDTIYETPSSFVSQKYERLFDATHKRRPCEQNT
jgi:hypothetical protein